ncbi:MAG: hypothetical protein ACM3NW_11980 [Syntrophomonadaceae bacterium]
MQRRVLARLGLHLCLGLLAAPGVSSAASPSRKSPHVEIIGEGTVATTPKETVHKNGRRFLEFEVQLSRVRSAAEQPTDADRGLSIDLTHPVRVVHDLSCGGRDLHLEKGDRIEIAGEYVQVPRGGDLIHFTHPADGSCGRAGGHPGGYLRKAAAPSRTPAPTPRPVSAVPDQPFRGTPRPAAKPYEEILAAKENGASEAELLARIEREGTVYSLSTADMRRLRDAGVSSRVIEAMLRSGRTPQPARTATPR